MPMRREEFPEVHIVLVAEPRRGYANMVTLLLYSLRRNGGPLRTAPVTMVMNGATMNDSASRRIQDRFAPLRIRVMPRIPGPIFASKFNAMYALDDHEWETMVYLDCDIVVYNDLTELLRRAGDAGFAAIAAGQQSFHDYRRLLSLCTAMATEELESKRDDRFSTRYPLFHGGMYVARRSHIESFRRDALAICHDLFSQRYSSPRQFLRFLYNDRLLNPKYASHVFERTAGKFLSPLGPYCPLWCTEQVGLAAAILRNRVPYELLPDRCVWNRPFYPDDGIAPPLFHYMRGIYPIDRNRLFDGAWVNQYRDDPQPMKRQLAELVIECRKDMEAEDS